MSLKRRNHQKIDAGIILLISSIMRVISLEEVRKHNAPDDCWVIIHNKVYDLSKFHLEHPGGSRMITKLAGMDGTNEFNKFHPSDFVERVGREDLCIGVIEAAHMQTVADSPVHDPSAERRSKAPHISLMLNIQDFKKEAERIMAKEGWDYYESGAGDEIILSENQAAFRRIRFRPRVLRDVSHVSTKATILGTTYAAPFYFSATALGKLAHPDGELAIIRGAKRANVPYMLPTLSSNSIDEMLGALDAGQKAWFQLYVNSDFKVVSKIVSKVSQHPCICALFLTVDAPLLGRRERDMRNKPAAVSDIQKDEAHDLKQKEKGVSNALSSFIDPSFTWVKAKKIKELTTLPVFLKGIQTAEDAIIAFDMGFSGVVLSNHGGRQVDTCRSAIEILVEVEEALRVQRGFNLQAHQKCAEAQHNLTNLKLSEDRSARARKFDVFIDGGVLRATDALKAISLGASAVGLGRAVLYGLAAYGEDGVARVASLLGEELATMMAMLGASDVRGVTRAMIQLPCEARL